MYEDKIASRFSDAFKGDPLALRTLSKFYRLAHAFATRGKYYFIIFDTSPSLGILNKVAISTADGLVIPCMPDMFSLYGIRNIGRSLGLWKKDFDGIYERLSADKRGQFPEGSIKLLRYTIYNAKKYSSKNAWDLANAHYAYAKQIPVSLTKYIGKEFLAGMSSEKLAEPIGGISVMHTHNTLPNMAQKYHAPMWKVPSLSGLETDDISTIFGNRTTYEATRGKYILFANSLLERL